MKQVQVTVRRDAEGVMVVMELEDAANGEKHQWGLRPAQAKHLAEELETAYGVAIGERLSLASWAD